MQAQRDSVRASPARETEAVEARLTARVASIRRGAWTSSDVADRLAEAMRVIARLPDHGYQPRAYRVQWPAMPRSVQMQIERTMERAIALHAAGVEDWIATDRTRVQPPPPDGAAITRADEALDWLWMVDRKRRTVLMARAAGARWHRIGHVLGVRRTTLWRWWTSGLATIARRIDRVG